MNKNHSSSNVLLISFFFSLFLLGIFSLSLNTATAEPFFKGAKVCEECHEAENKIWEKTKHYTAFRTAHREPKDASKPSPKKILKAVGGQKRMKRNEACSLCHYTLEQKDAESKPVARSGTSCESCHGASSEWLALHDNYGGKDVKPEQETPEHKKERVDKSRAAGLIWPSMKYQVAENCMTCHGLAHPDLTGDTLAKMLGAGHPINPGFELVKYSQGTVRHRYYPPDRTVNTEMTKAEQAELFVIGHAAALVSAKEAMSKSNEPKYTEAQNKRMDNAKAALSAVKSIPEAAALIASPNRENALKLVDAMEGKELSEEVGNMLPAKGDYK
jgi:cytochrome c554/c'-like protein